MIIEKHNGEGGSSPAKKEGGGGRNVLSPKEWREGRRGGNKKDGKGEEVKDSLNRAQGSLNAARRIMFT